MNNTWVTPLSFLTTTSRLSLTATLATSRWPPPSSAPAAEGGCSLAMMAAADSEVDLAEEVGSAGGIPLEDTDAGLRKG